MYNKPPSISDKEWLISLLSEKLGVPRDTINTVVQDTFMALIKEMPLHNELEISGLGKFIFRQAPARKQLARYEKGIEEGKYKNEEIEKAVRDNIAYIKGRLHE